MIYPKKYDHFFKQITQKEPQNSTEALELLVQNDFSNELTPLQIAIQLKKFPLPNIKTPLERYPEFKEYKLDIKPNSYINKINSYTSFISREISLYNHEKKQSSLNAVIYFLEEIKDMLSDNKK